MNRTEITTSLEEYYSKDNVFETDYITKLLNGEADINIVERKGKAFSLGNQFSTRTYSIENSYLEEIMNEIEFLKAEREKINEQLNKLYRGLELMAKDQRVMIHKIFSLPIEETTQLNKSVEQERITEEQKVVDETSETNKTNKLSV